MSLSKFRLRKELNRLEDLSEKCQGTATMEHPWQSDRKLFLEIYIFEKKGGGRIKLEYLQWKFKWLGKSG